MESCFELRLNEATGEESVAEGLIEPAIITQNPRVLVVAGEDAPVTGLVRARGEKNKNPNLATGGAAAGGYTYMKGSEERRLKQESFLRMQTTAFILAENQVGAPAINQQKACSALEAPTGAMSKASSSRARSTLIVGSSAPTRLNIQLRAA